MSRIEHALALAFALASFPLGAAAQVEPTEEAPAAPSAPAPATPPSEPSEPAGTAADDEAALAALTSDATADEAATEEGDPDAPKPVQVYGFADITYRHLLIADDNPWLLFLNRHPSLFVGNLNLYLDAQLASRWRALFEVRFTYLPHGAHDIDLQTGNGSRESTTTGDYTDYSRGQSVGSIVIERAQVEWAVHERLTLKVGQWLTPYGIWNVDHGSPVIIGVSRPFILGAQLLPEHQVGLMADGSVPLGEQFQLGYMLSASNGRIDTVAYEDLDSNKALTARASLGYHGVGRLTLGATFYKGRHTSAVNQLFFDGNVPKSREQVRQQFDELSYAVDLLYRYEGLHLQSEWMVNDRRYTERGRPPGPNGGLRPDKRNWGGYGLLGYRTPFFTLMPYAKAEYSPEPQLQSIGIDDQIVILTFGINLRPLPAVVFKTEYFNGFFPDGDADSFAGYVIQGVDAQLAVSF